MGESNQGALAGRVGRLERDTEEMRAELRHVNQRLDRALLARDTKGNLSTVAGEPPASPAVSPGPRWDGGAWTTDSEKRFGLPFDLGNLGDYRSGEWWLNKIGIGLLLFGVAFLYLLSVEQGWIMPPVRVGFGLTVGVALVALGLHVYERRRSFAQVLLGGGIGTFYISGFAAFQLYALVPYPLVFGYMVAVTALAFVFALRQDGATLALVGALGALGTPFLLHTEAGTLGGLVLYTCVVLAGISAVYLYKGWASLFGVAFAGGWTVLLVGYATSFSAFSAPDPGDRIILQVGVAFAWLLFAVVAVARESLLPPDSGGFLRGAVHALAVPAPLTALAFTAGIWNLSSFDSGWVALSGAALYALAALALHHLAGRLFYIHALVALLLLMLAPLLMLEGDALFLTLATGAAILHLVARRLFDRIVAWQAHALASAVAVWLAARLLGVVQAFFGASEAALPAIPDVVDLAVIALAFGTSTFLLGREARAYRVAAHVALLAWLWRELSVLPGGDAYVTVAWGLYAAALLVTGLRLDRAALVRGGLATLFLVTGKLFLVDLAEVEAIWRVLLFLGFGGLFLALSYFFQALWRPATGAPREHPAADEP